MRLVDSIPITVDGVTVMLRPSLRAAYRLHTTQGYQKIAIGIAEGRVSVVADVLRYGADSPDAGQWLARDIERFGAVRLAVIAPALTSFLRALIGLDDEPTHKPEATSGKRQSFQEFYERLFALGTGWLGWSPADTWNATPAEILAAYNGRVEMLKAIYGSTEKTDKQPESDPTEEVSREEVLAGIAALKANARRGKGNR